MIWSTQAVLKSSSSFPFWSESIVLALLLHSCHFLIFELWPNRHASTLVSQVFTGPTKSFLSYVPSVELGGLVYQFGFNVVRLIVVITTLIIKTYLLSARENSARMSKFHPMAKKLRLPRWLSNSEAIRNKLYLRAGQNYDFISARVLKKLQQIDLP